MHLYHLFKKCVFGPLRFLANILALSGKTSVTCTAWQRALLKHMLKIVKVQRIGKSRGFENQNARLSRYLQDFYRFYSMIYDLIIQ